MRRILGTSIRKFNAFIRLAINPNNNCKLVIKIGIRFNNLLWFQCKENPVGIWLCSLCALLVLIWTMSLCPFPPFLVFLGGTSSSSRSLYSLAQAHTVHTGLVDRVGARMLRSFSALLVFIVEKRRMHTHTKGHPHKSTVISSLA